MWQIVSIDALPKRAHDERTRIRADLVPPRRAARVAVGGCAGLRRGVRRRERRRHGRGGRLQPQRRRRWCEAPLPGSCATRRTLQRACAGRAVAARRLWFGGGRHTGHRRVPGTRRPGRFHRRLPRRKGQPLGRRPRNAHVAHQRRRFHCRAAGHARGRAPHRRAACLRRRHLQRRHDDAAPGLRTLEPVRGGRDRGCEHAGRARAGLPPGPRGAAGDVLGHRRSIDALCRRQGCGPRRWAGAVGAGDGRILGPRPQARGEPADECVARCRR